MSEQDNQQLAAAERLCRWACATLTPSVADLRILLRDWAATLETPPSGDLLDAIATHMYVVHSKVAA